ncbi:MAG: hypothetical protein WEB55_05695, partial [Acidimicrobiia bacterium]
MERFVDPGGGSVDRGDVRFAYGGEGRAGRVEDGGEAVDLGREVDLSVGSQARPKRGGEVGVGGSSFPFSRFALSRCLLDFGFEPSYMVVEGRPQLDQLSRPFAGDPLLGFEPVDLSKDIGI